MSAAVSTRTLIRDAVTRLLNARKQDELARVPQFAVSRRYLKEQETNQKNTYCVIVTDEEAADFTQRARAFQVTVKIVCYAYDQTDPHTVLDAMIEEVHDVVGLLRDQPELYELVSQVTPQSVKTDEGTTAALPWGQAVCEWTARHARA